MRKFLPSFALCLVLLQACVETTPAETPIAAQSTPIASQAAVITPEIAATEATPLPSPQPEVEPVLHLIIPATGTSDRATAHDHENTLTYSSKKVKAGDEFYKNRFERPFTALEMDYLPDVDIMNFSITSDENFFYVNISLAGLDPASQSLNGSYGVEIDRNADGRAELLLVARPPYAAEFTANNTAAYMDLNGDVGGSVINRPDDSAGDGFETTVFDLAQGVYPQDDPDLVWARQTTDGSLPAVEIAFKKWIFKDGREAFMWSALASRSPIDPAVFVFHDHYSAAQAGAANTDDPNYPLKELAALDNTCRVPYGFQAVGNEPFGCFVKGGEMEVKAAPLPDSTCGQFLEFCSRAQ